MVSPAILLLGARRRVYFARRLLELLPAHGLERVVSSDVDDLDPLRHFVDGFFLLPPSSEDGFVNRLLESCRAQNVKLVIGWNDQDIRVLHDNRSALQNAGVRLCTPPSPYTEMFLDKWQTARWARENGIRHPGTMVGDADAPAMPREWRFPVYTKPPFGQGSLGVYRIETHQELHSTAQRYQGPFLIQQAVDGTEFTVDIAVDRGRAIFIVPRKRIKVRGGEVLIAQVDLANDVIAFARSVIAATDFCGVFNMQVIRSEEGVHLIELNPRFGGGSDLSIRAGADIPRCLLESAMNGSISWHAPILGDGLIMSRYHEAVFFDGATTASRSESLERAS